MLKIVLVGFFLFIIVWKYLGFEMAKSIIGITNYPALIITGAFALMLGLKRSKWSALFGFVAIILYIKGL